MNLLEESVQAGGENDAARDDSSVMRHQLVSGREGWPDDPPARRAARESVNRRVEEIFYDNFLRYFQNAEAKRRWSIDHDIPWDQANPNTSDLTADIVESFSAVEMFLPDYTHKIMELVRASRGRAWFQANWGYEESKHSMVLERWLQASGKRTEEQTAAFERSLLGAEWRLPFETARQMIVYTTVQELATGINYTNLRRRAEDEGDACLSKVLRWVSADESAHYNFFRRAVKTYLELEPEDTIADIRYVFEHFAMPAHALIPGWEARGAQIEAAGVYGPRMYISKIYKPVLEDLGLTRQQLKDAGVPVSEADEIGDARDEAEHEKKQASFHRTRNFPKIPAPESSTRKLVQTA